MNKKTLLSTLLFCLALLFAEAKVKLPALFSDNLLLQQQTEAAIWGWASSGSDIKIVTSWNGKSYTTKADKSGKWKTKVSTPQGSFTTYTISITGDGSNLQLNNVLIGEVWFCSGQSNMEMTMRGFRGQPIDESNEAIMSSRNPNIRLFTVKRQASATLTENCTGNWQEASPSSVIDFGATAYFFGRALFQNLNIPIGLINSAWGGTKIQAWTPAEGMKDFPEKKLPTPDTDVKSPSQVPTSLFNGMVNPVAGYGIKGAIWYQGESDRNEPQIYAQMFGNMVSGWRKVWGVGEFPVYYVQIAPFNYPDLHGKGLNSGLIREAQLKAMSQVSKVGMVVQMDSHSPMCIHPPKKRMIGERLALYAMAENYGMDKVAYKSPTLKSMETNGMFITLTFDAPHTNGFTSYDKEIKNFRVAGENKRFFPARATVYQDKIFVFAPEVEKPLAVRYCFDDTSASEIFTVSGGLPISSFRTDDWVIE